MIYESSLVSSSEGTKRLVIAFRNSSKPHRVVVSEYALSNLHIGQLRLIPSVPYQVSTHC